MGFDLQAVRYIFEAKRTGADFSNALTLGRQNLHVDAATYRKEAARFGLPARDEAFGSLPFADGLLETLGAQQPSSLDVSPYEGATHVADMNLPLPAGLAGRFSLVIDGGTLEHVFNFRQAAINVGQLLKVGGHLISITCANNFLGHGFYQFSPELFYRVFSAENGFEVESLVLTEVNGDGAWYEVADPAKVRSRVTLVNGARTYMMMRARKTADVEMFRQIPQQSDYHDARWQETPGTVEGTEFLQGSRLQRLVETRFPRPVRHAMRRLKQGLTDHFASPHLRKVRSF
jgi:SAM-dependent methyltransferase